MTNERGTYSSSAGESSSFFELLAGGCLSFFHLFLFLKLRYFIVTGI